MTKESNKYPYEEDEVITAAETVIDRATLKVHALHNEYLNGGLKQDPTGLEEQIMADAVQNAGAILDALTKPREQQP